MRDTLRRGEAGAVELARLACEKLGEDHPAVKAFMEILAAVARGDPGFSGRHVGSKLSAAVHSLEWLIGKPKQPIEHSGKIALEQLVLDSLPGPDKPGG